MRTIKKAICAFTTLESLFRQIFFSIGINYVVTQTCFECVCVHWCVRDRVRVCVLTYRLAYTQLSELKQTQLQSLLQGLVFEAHGSRVCRQVFYR